MENGSGEGGERTIKRAFIRTAEAESDKNQESLEKTWRRAATQQLKTSLAHHSERILDSTVRKKKNLILKGGLEARGASTEQGEPCWCVIGLYLQQKVLCLSTFPVFSHRVVAAATPATLESSGDGSAGPVGSGGGGGGPGGERGGCRKRPALCHIGVSENWH